jgi:hypothetical protein
MGVIKNGEATGFDRLVRSLQAESILSLIYATYSAWKDDSITEKIERKRKIAENLKYFYQVFRGKSGTYGDGSKDILDQFESQYTIGNDVGIWVSSDFKLSKYAEKVALNEITVREYLSRVFINLFVYIRGEYTHVLYQVCDYMERENKAKIMAEDFSKALNFSTNSRDQANLLEKFLLDTVFFVPVDEKEKELVIATGYTVQSIKDMCNLEYKEQTMEENLQMFDTTKRGAQGETAKYNYANYIAKPYENKKVESYNGAVEKLTVQEEIEEYECNLRTETVQKIIYGPPGIGKSYSITREIEASYDGFKLEDDNPYVFRTTFHPEYSYNDFVGQIMPVVKEKEITYDFTPGIFTQALEKAINYDKKDVYLVLEEMSRANVAAIFGDIFQLLDRKDGVSEYKVNHDLISKEIYKTRKKIFLPKNLHIIGTVNTSDQNVYVMDTAFKRRFNFEYMSLKPVSKDGVYLNQYSMSFMNSNKTQIDCNWIEFYQVLNRFIVKELKLSEDKQVGQFFIKFGLNANQNNKAINNKLLQYLWQDIHLASFSNKFIFQPNIETFSEAHASVEDSFLNKIPITVFSDEFLDEINSFREMI